LDDNNDSNDSNDSIIAHEEHASPCGRLQQLEGRVTHLSARLDSMKETVARNQEEFKTRITGLEGNQQNFMVQLAQHRSEYRTGTALLAFLIMAGIALVGALQI
jgi:TolA-binding protein